MSRIRSEVAPMQSIISRIRSEIAPVQSRKTPSIKYSHISLIKSHMTQNNFTSAAVNVTSTKVGRTHTRLKATYPKRNRTSPRSEEHTSELQSRFDLVCRL